MSELEPLAPFGGAVSWDLIARLAVAALLGGLIGGEREYSGHDAGLRTNILVALGACLFTILSIFAFPDINGVRDPARLAAQIVSGIGFLGAGAVFRDGDKVRGMTTAATIWLVAAIGMSVGAGFYWLASAATLLTLAVLTALAPLSAAIKHRRHQRRAPPPED